VEPGERVLASAAGDTGVVVATDRRLLVPQPDGHLGIGWETIERATWDGDGELLTIVQTAPLGSRPRPHRLKLEDAGRLLDVVREQVTASVVISRYVLLDGRRGVRITGRRRPGQSGLSWVVAVDNGLSVDAPGVRDQIASAVARVQAEVE
jgi:hypothetical protein